MSRLESELLNYESKYIKDGILINKLNITNQDDLDKAERMITSYKLARLYLEPSCQKFDVNHYLSIHKFLFGDIYDFAGKIRDENITKGIPFCLPNYIYHELDRTLRIARNRVKTIDSRDKLLAFVTELSSDLNIIHPFREGNGRTEREFIRQFIDYICKTNNLEDYYLNYSLITDKQSYLNAVIKAAAYVDYSDLLVLYDSILVIKDKKLEQEEIEILEEYEEIFRK